MAVDWKWWTASGRRRRNESGRIWNESADREQGIFLCSGKSHLARWRVLVLQCFASADCPGNRAASPRSVLWVNLRLTFSRQRRLFKSGIAQTEFLFGGSGRLVSPHATDRVLPLIEANAGKLIRGRGFSMKPRRQSALAVVSLFVLFCLSAFIASHDGKAQKKPDAKPSPTPAKELLTVEPVLPPAPAKETKETPKEQPGDPQQKPGTEVDDKIPVITNTDLITFTVTVTDLYGRFVSGLSKNAFTIFDNKEAQEIAYFSDDDTPVSVGVIFDVSGSMSGDKVRRARDALAHFIQTSHDRDEYFLIGFNSRAQLLIDRTRDGNAVL